MKEYKNFYIFLLALIILLLVPNLLQIGMFVDGLWYATIANNLANGLGSFWQPMFTETMFAEFYEHPPLVFGIQAVFFNLFGSSLWVEKLYAFVVFIISFFLIKSLWKEVFHSEKNKQKLWFIPVLLWFLCETVYLMYTNNVLECTQTIFVLSSIILVLKGIRKEQKILLFLAGIFVLLAFLSKGVTGLFPLISIVIFHIVFSALSFKKVLLFTSFILLGFSTIFLLFLIEPESFTNISNYLETQVLSSLNGESKSNMQFSRFYILKALLQVHLVPIILVFIVSLVSFFKFKRKVFSEYKSKIYFFLLIGLSGSLPILLSQKQASYYLITTAPFFAIVLSLILIQQEKIIQQLKTSKIFTGISIVLLVVALVISYGNINTINNRDKILLNDLAKLDAILVKHKSTTIGCKTTKRYDALYGFMMRKYQISLDTIHPFKNKLLISNISLEKEDFKKIKTTSKAYNLYIKQ